MIDHACRSIGAQPRRVWVPLNCRSSCTQHGLMFHPPSSALAAGALIELGEPTLILQSLHSCKGSFIGFIMLSILPPRKCVSIKGHLLNSLYHNSTSPKVRFPRFNFLYLKCKIQGGFIARLSLLNNYVLIVLQIHITICHIFKELG